MINASVVIPVLDEEDSLPKCFGELFSQLEAGDEVIVVDGGSEDKTVEIAKAAGCRVLLDEEGTIGSARHAGTEASKNEVVVSTDADALPPDGWLDRIKSRFEKDDDLVVLYGTIQDSNGKPIRNILGKASTLFRGASGNNTAFRKDVYEEMKGGYPDWSFAEDAAIINRLAREGKCVRDEKLVMVMDMQRKRYQTIPMVLAGAGSALAGLKLGGKYGKIISRAGVGMAGTELVYEGFTDTPFHHEDVGMGLAAGGNRIGGDIGEEMLGLGSGIFAHHLFTEGFAKIPSRIMRNTDKIIDGD